MIKRSDVGDKIGKAISLLLHAYAARTASHCG